MPGIYTAMYLKFMIYGSNKADKEKLKNYENKSETCLQGTGVSKKCWGTFLATLVALHFTPVSE